MNKNIAIGSCLKLSFDALLAVKKLGPENRLSLNAMVYITENLLTAAMISENIDMSMARRDHGNHQIDRMVDLLPDACSVKSKFLDVSGISIYATTFRYPTPSGRMPKPADEGEGQAYFDTLTSILKEMTVHFKVNVRLNEPVSGNTLPIRDDNPEPS